MTERDTGNKAGITGHKVGWAASGFGFLSAVLAAITPSMPPLLAWLGYISLANDFAELPLCVYNILHGGAAVALVTAWGLVVTNWNADDRWSIRAILRLLVLLGLSIYVIDILRRYIIFYTGTPNSMF